jgi:hypothetical protein
MFAKGSHFIKQGACLFHGFRWLVIIHGVRNLDKYRLSPFFRFVERLGSAPSSPKIWVLKNWYQKLVPIFGLRKKQGSINLKKPKIGSQKLGPVQTQISKIRKPRKKAQVGNQTFRNEDPRAGLKL